MKAFSVFLLLLLLVAACSPSPPPAGEINPFGAREMTTLEKFEKDILGVWRSSDCSWNNSAEPKPPFNQWEYVFQPDGQFYFNVYHFPDRSCATPFLYFGLEGTYVIQEDETTRGLFKAHFELRPTGRSYNRGDKSTVEFIPSSPLYPLFKGFTDLFAVWFPIRILNNHLFHSGGAINYSTYYSRRDVTLWEKLGW